MKTLQLKSSDIKCWLEYEHTVCFVSELGFSSVVFNFLNSSITRGPPIPFSFLKYWLTFSLISSTVEKSTFLSSSAALLTRRPSVVPINDMLDSYWMFEEFQSWNLKYTFYILPWLYKLPYLDNSGMMYGPLVYDDELQPKLLRYLHFFAIIMIQHLFIRDLKRKIRCYIRWYCKIL